VSSIRPRSQAIICPKKLALVSRTAGREVSAEFAAKAEQEIRSALEREVDAERWTRLDAAIRIGGGRHRLYRPAAPTIR